MKVLEDILLNYNSKWTFESVCILCFRHKNNGKACLDCTSCEFFNQINCLKYLESEVKTTPKYKLSTIEYYVLATNAITQNDVSFSDQKILNELSDLGYYKRIPKNATPAYILANCEVLPNE